MIISTRQLQGFRRTVVLLRWVKKGIIVSFILILVSTTIQLSKTRAAINTATTPIFTTTNSPDMSTSSRTIPTSTVSYSSQSPGNHFTETHQDDTFITLLKIIVSQRQLNEHITEKLVASLTNVDSRYLKIALINRFRLTSLKICVKLTKDNSKSGWVKKKVTWGWFIRRERFNFSYQPRMIALGRTFILQGGGAWELHPQHVPDTGTKIA